MASYSIFDIFDSKAIAKLLRAVGVPTTPKIPKTWKSLINFFVLNAAKLGSYLSSRLISSIFFPFTPTITLHSFSIYSQSKQYTMMK